jgi:hypothetical protein|tara:strand:+ start:329 stop:499 length:171 start_codon:yes stop_codon:yes gene_type:complete
MTRRDFIIIADSLLKVKKHTSTETFADVSHTIAEHLKDKCSNFNMKYFQKYLNTEK